MTRRKLFLFLDADESTLGRPKIIETASEEEKNKNIIRNRLASALFFLFTFVLRHILCCRLQLFSLSLLPSSCVSTFQHLSLRDCLMLFFSNARSLFLSLPLVFFILHGFSPVIQAKLQSLIRPVEAPIWPLISISDLQ